MTKQCTKCKEIKDVELFYVRKSHKDGLHSWCKPCCNKSSIACAKKDPNKDNYKRNWYYQRDYGITLDQYNQLFTKQDGLCALCHRHQSEFKIALAVDHCHTTGQVRGLLCDPCNRGIGMLQESVEILLRGVDYLQRFKP